MRERDRRYRLTNQSTNPRRIISMPLTTCPHHPHPQCSSAASSSAWAGSAWWSGRAPSSPRGSTGGRWPLRSASSSRCRGWGGKAGESECMWVGVSCVCVSVRACPPTQPLPPTKRRHASFYLLPIITLTMNQYINPSHNPHTHTYKKKHHITPPPPTHTAWPTTGAARASPRITAS